jgi:hypothetical protein
MSDLPSLHTCLLNLDHGVLKVIAQFWGFDPKGLSFEELAQQLNNHMINLDVAEAMWDKLSDDERQAVQTFLGSKGKMTQSFMERAFGKIRKMGESFIKQHKPHENPASIAESLYYKGFIHEGFEHIATGTSVFWFIPPQLMMVLPSNKTGYDYLGDDPIPLDDDEADDDIPTIPILTGNIIPRLTADTSIVDDTTALLAYVQVRGGKMDGMYFSDDDTVALAPQLLNSDEVRLDFMIAVALSAGLLEERDSHLYVRRAEARKWLEDKRTNQLQTLIHAWLDSTIYQELWHVPNLYPQATLDNYHPQAGRKALREFLRDYTPKGKGAWWSQTDFISLIHETEPDFQRPNGDYNRWYITNEDDEYLSGFENWDAIEGALLEFYINSPLFWLGMVDLADDAVRFTVYGRAFIGWEAFPNVPETDEPMKLNTDGTILISRKAPRIDRFQVMRFTAWEGKANPNTPYTYKLTPESIARANEQDITAEHITTFLKRITHNAPLPASVTKLLTTNQPREASSVTLERLLVLRTTSLEVMNFILETPALRRYLGARLGDLAVVVRADQWEALRSALDEKGITLEVIS